MPLDDWMPAWDVVERHETLVRAPRDRAWSAVRTLDLSRSPVVRTLFALRSLPGLFARRGRRRALGATLDDLLRMGFVLLEERPGEEVVLGLVGKFWRPSGCIRRVTPEELRAFAEPGWAVAAWNFTLNPAGDGAVRVATETRVRCTDAASRRRFRAYWLLVGPFSALIRREMLRAIRRTAEDGTTQGGSGR